MVTIERRVVRISQNGAAGAATDVSALPLASYTGAVKNSKIVLFSFSMFPSSIIH